MQVSFRTARRARWMVLTCVATASLWGGATSCDGGTGLGPSGFTFLMMDSAPADWVGQGRSWHYTLADGVWTARYDQTSSQLGNAVFVTFRNDETYWHVNLAAPPGQSLRVGTYENARRYPFNESQPGLSVDGDGRGCNELTGRFAVHELVFGATGFVDRLRATFEQHCEGASPALTGEVSVVANPWR